MAKSHLAYQINKVIKMIKVSRINGKRFVINCDLIELVEETPDTVITLTTGKKLVIKESVDEVIEKVIKFKRSTFVNGLITKRKEV